MARQPTPSDVTRAVGGRAAVIPSLLWLVELGGEGDFAPHWLYGHLSRLGYGSGPAGAGFWWRTDIPLKRAERLVALFEELDEAYLDDDEPC